MAPDRLTLNPLPALWRRFYWLPRDARHIPAMRRAGHGFYFPGGLGDELLCTVPMREFARRGLGRSLMFSGHPELFKGNPDVTGIASPADAHAFSAWQRWGGRLHQPTYNRSDPNDPDHEIPPAIPLAAEMCLRCGLEGEIEPRPWLHLAETERANAASYAGALVFQISVAGARHPYRNKEWSFSRWHELAGRLAPGHRIVQVGTADDPPLGIGEDLRGRTTLRELAALLSQSRLFVGLVGFCMHLARAAETPAVIVYGGRERPDQSGYPCNENLYSAEPCAPCWLKSRCDFGRRCLEHVSVEAVLEAVRRQLDRPRAPLASGRFQLLPQGAPCPA